MYKTVTYAILLSFLIMGCGSTNTIEQCIDEPISLTSNPFIKAEHQRRINPYAKAAHEAALETDKELLKGE